MKQYAVYRGDEYLCGGTVDECAEYLGIKPSSVQFMSYPAFRKRQEKRKRPEDCTIVVAVNL